MNLSLGIGVLLLLVIWGIYGVLSGSFNPLKLIEGADGRLSTSKFQWWIWIWAIAFTYLTLYAARWLASDGVPSPISDIPENVLAVLGFSTGTATVAKGVTQAYASAGLVSKPAKATGGTAPSELVLDDGGYPDLYKLQIFIWTLIAVGIYIAGMISLVTSAAATADPAKALTAAGFPDIDTSLMLLSGLSATGYLGKKLVTRDGPKIASVTPSRAPAGQPVNIVVLGSGFGPKAAGSSLNVGASVNLPTTSWAGQEIHAALPATFPAGVHEVSVIIAGVKSGTSTIELT